MANRTDLIRQRLIDEGRKTAAFCQSLTPAQLEQAVYQAGPAWRVRDLIAHLASTEREIHRLIRDVLAGGQGTPAGFNIDAFNAAETAALRGQAPAELAQDFAAARADTVALVETLAEADLDRRGRHPFLGDAPLDDMLKLLYRHTMLHERDARKALEAGHPLPGAPE